jgi:hypothetical protein
MKRRHMHREMLDPITKSELGELERDIRKRRKRVFQNHLARTIRLASPLLLDACTKDELDEVVWRMEPGDSWPNRRGQRATIRGWSARSRRHDRGHMVAMNRLTGEGFAVLDLLTLRIGRNAMHMAFRIGTISIATFGRGGCLTMPRPLDDGPLPELVGAPLDSVVALPIVTDRPYGIVSVLPVPMERSVLIQFDAAPTEWSVPWARPWDVPF